MLEIFKSCLDTVLGNELWVAPLESGGLDKTTSRGSFHPQPVCDSVISMSKIIKKFLLKRQSVRSIF